MDKAPGRMLLQFAENPQSLGYDTEDPDGTDAPSSVVGLQTDQQGTENGTHTHVEVPTKHTYSLLERGAFVPFLSVL